MKMTNKDLKKEIKKILKSLYWESLFSEKRKEQDNIEEGIIPMMADQIIKLSQDYCDGVIEELEEIVRANHMRSDVGYGLGMRKLILLKDLFKILTELRAEQRSKNEKDNT